MRSAWISKVAFIEIGHKFAAHARGDQPAQDHSNCSCGQYDRLGGHDTVEQWTIQALGMAQQEVFLLADPIADEQGHRCGDECHRQNHGAQQCRDHVNAMGWNIFPSTPVSAKMGRYTTMMMS